MEHLDYDGVEYFVTGASTMNGAIEDEGNTAANLTWAGENFSGFSRVLATAEELTVDFLDSMELWFIAIHSTITMLIPLEYQQ